MKRIVAVTALLFIALTAYASAQDEKSSPSPAPTTTPPVFQLNASSLATYVNTAAAGSGLSPSEGPAFIQGAPLAPMTPYDTWSSAPLTPGEAGSAWIDLTPTYNGARYNASATLAAGVVTGNTQNAIYWGESLMPTFNPHLGSTALPYTISFPTSNGQDGTTATRISLLDAAFGATDGSWQLRGGFFDLAQTARFVFIQPPLTNVTPSIGVALPESLGTGSPAIDAWPSPEPGLPLNGVDAMLKRGNASLEVSNASLPALPGTAVHTTIASLMLNGPNQYGFQYLHASSGGNSIATTTLYGADAMTNPGPQGPLPTSTLGGQTQSIAGAYATVAAARNVTATAELGHSWYTANDVLEPGTSAPSGFYHLGAAFKPGDSEYSLNAYRWEGGYADMILPYGTPENVWSVAWSWPGVWLKSTYQLVDNLLYPGSNRQGYRASYAFARQTVQVKADYARFSQIVPSTLDNVHITGFVDGFFLPQYNDAGTIGAQQQYRLWASWQAPFARVTLDAVDDVMHRPAFAGHPEDFVGYSAPQAILTFSRAFGKNIVADAGFGRYSMRGSFAQTYTNVDFFQNVYFAGVQFKDAPHGYALVQLRRSAFAGLPSFLGGPSPNFQATTLIVEQRMQ